MLILTNHYKSLMIPCSIITFIMLVIDIIIYALLYWVFGVFRMEYRSCIMVQWQLSTVCHWKEAQFGWGFLFFLVISFQCEWKYYHEIQVIINGRREMIFIKVNIIILLILLRLPNLQPMNSVTQLNTINGSQIIK